MKEPSPWLHLDSSHGQIEKDKPLEEGKEKLFRAPAAGANYLSADRTDIQYAVKDVVEEWLTLPLDTGT